MDLQFKNWIIGLSYALAAITVPAMSQDQNLPDSLPVKELVITTINASQPDSLGRGLMLPHKSVTENPETIKKGSSISDLHPMAIAFVQDYLEDNTERLVYFAEHNAQPEKFSSIPKTLWWSVVTLTTVGYGDMIPETIIGKILTSVILLIGVALFALPAGIITAGFLDEMRNHKKDKSHTCPHCGKSLDHHDEKAHS